MSNPDLSRRTLTESHGNIERDKDLLHSILCGKFSNMQFNRPQTEIHGDFVENLNHSKPDSNLHKFNKIHRSIYRTTRNYFTSNVGHKDANCSPEVPVLTFKDAHKNKINSEFGINSAQSPSFDHHSSITSADLKICSSFRFFTYKKYAILFLLFLFITFFFYGTVFGEPSFRISDVLRSKADLVSKGVIYQGFQILGLPDLWSHTVFQKHALDLKSTYLSFSKNFWKAFKTSRFLLLHHLQKMLINVEIIGNNSTRLVLFYLGKISINFKSRLHADENSVNVQNKKENKEICLMRNSNFCNITEENSKYVQISKATIKNEQKGVHCTMNCDYKFILSEYAVPFEKMFLATMKKMIHNTNRNNFPSIFHEWFRLKLESIKNVEEMLNHEFQILKINVTMDPHTAQKMVEYIMKNNYTKYEEINRRAVAKLITYDKHIVSIFQKLVNDLFFLYEAESEDFTSESAGLNL